MTTAGPGRPDPAEQSDERLVDLLVEQYEQEHDDDVVDRSSGFPLRLVEAGDDTHATGYRDSGGWSAEELAMHLVDDE
jgi:hypothetical protein